LIYAALDLAMQDHDANTQQDDTGDRQNNSEQGCSIRR